MSSVIHDDGKNRPSHKGIKRTYAETNTEDISSVESEDSTNNQEVDDDQPKYLIKQQKCGDEDNSDSDTDRLKSAKKIKRQKLDDGTLTNTNETPKYSNCNVVATHYNQLKESGTAHRLYSKILYLRNFNNWIKSQLILEYVNKIRSTQPVGSALRVLDLCCGKGGDLFKWEHCKISHLICTDIAEVSIEQCKQRYKDMIDRASASRFGHRFTAEFFACDATMVRLRERYKDPSMKLNLVSCQFALHYSFESLTQAKCMIKNASECLAPGGYFIATIPDALQIMKRLQLQSTDGKKFGNSIYNIEFQCDTNPPPLFGAKYLFHLDDVVDCPEFLIHFETLVKLCRQYGLKLEKRQCFEDFYRDNYECGKRLLQKMRVFEVVSLRTTNPNDDNYSHFTQFAQNGNPNKQYSTLSKAEWEAATLYLVCAFVKCKNSWDADGKPVFEFD